MAFKILLRAAPGDLSRILASQLEDQPLELVLADTGRWRDREAIGPYLAEVQPSIVVNFPTCAEPSEEELLIHSVICAHCKTAAVPLIHISSYRVFGEASGVDALTESQIPEPRDALGSYLCALETACAALDRHIILRCSWLLGQGMENALARLLGSLLAGPVFRVSDHDFGNPINVSFLANVVCAMSQQILCGAENWGTFHVHGSDKCSEAELCDVLVRLLGAELDRPVAMPEVAGVGNTERYFRGNALLAGRRCTENFGIQLPSWRKGLKGLVRQYLEREGYPRETEKS